MAKSKKMASYIAVPSLIINSISSSSLQSLLFSPASSSSTTTTKKQLLSSSFSLIIKSPKLWLSSLLLFTLLGTLTIFGLNLNLNLNLDKPPSLPCPSAAAQPLISNGFSSPDPMLAVESVAESKVLTLRRSDESSSSSSSSSSPFWKQPDGLGYRPCLSFSSEYRRASEGMVRDRTRYLMVVLNGGLNQQRNQLVDAVVIARILGAALVAPVLEVNAIWGDESEFSDIFDLDHFKSALANDVRILSSLPSTHITTRLVEEKRTPLLTSPHWIRSRYFKRINRDGVLVLRGLDSRLSKDLPSDLQKLRCKAAFHALRFATPILQLGNKLAERMRSKGPYLALHLRLEKDVWVRTGCLPGLSRKYDEIVTTERKKRPELLTDRSNMANHARKLAGLCPLNALEVTRLLKALGAPRDTRIYWAGGQPLGGDEALLPLTREFPNLHNKEDLALDGELEPFANRASVMAAIDYVVSEKSDVFMPSRGGNMGHAIQGHRAYAGHKKYITPNKRQMIRHFLNVSLPDAEFNKIIAYLHRDSLGQPKLRRSKSGSDVTKYPVPECMCKDDSSRVNDNSSA